MAQIGLKDTLTLLAKGYSKKEIDALASIDEKAAEEQEAPKETPAPAPEVSKEETPAEDEPDYKALYEEQLKKNEELEQANSEKEDKIKKIQKNNTNENSLPDLEVMKEANQASLIDAFRSFY